MIVKCINCIFCRTIDTNDYDSDISKYDDIKFECAFNHQERDVLCNRYCEKYQRINSKRRCTYGNTVS